MPERLRAAFDLRFGNSEQRRARRAVAVLRYAYPILPRRVRHVGPYQEALARTAGRGRPDLLTHSLHLFWIGRSSMRNEFRDRAGSKLPLRQPRRPKTNVREACPNSIAACSPIRSNAMTPFPR